MVPKRNQLVQGVPLTEEEKAKLPPLPYTEVRSPTFWSIVKCR